MLKCREVYEIASDYIDGDLGRWARIQMRLHLAMCRHCSRLVRQLEYGRRIVREEAGSTVIESASTARSELLATYDARYAAPSGSGVEPPAHED
ncbi:MAG: zf-HC2 domain-containing protein [Deltaproteobacteria bacterium]|nr:MAG: zf-HC2 domain-containing protein [Deltaproteobacteria bacterium]